MNNIDVVNDLRRKAIGRIILIFFGFMIILTFFSNTISNFTLPKISVDNPKEGTLLKKITGDGIINAKDITDIYVDSDDNCKVREVKVEAGDKVSKGDELLLVEKVNGEASEKQKKIDMLTYEKMKLIYQEMLEDYNTEVNQKGLLADMDISLMSDEQAERRLKNVKELYDSGAETLENYKSMEMNYEIAKKEYETKVEGYETARKKELSSIRKYEIDLKMQEEKMNQNVASSIIYAPLDGVVKEVYITNGTWVNKTTKLITITNKDSAFQFSVDIDIDNADLIKPGDKVTIKVIALGNEFLQGEVINVNESKNFKGVKKEVVAKIYDANPEDRLINKISGGERGQIYIEKETLNYTFLVPNTAVIPGISETEGYVRMVKERNGFLGKENYIEIRDVLILDSDNNQTAIDGGITPDDKIVIKTNKPLKEQGRVLVEYQLEDASGDE
jgi:HlyD family secretion protein